MCLLVNVNHVNKFLKIKNDIFSHSFSYFFLSIYNRMEQSYFSWSYFQLFKSLFWKTCTILISSSSILVHWYKWYKVYNIYFTNLVRPVNCHFWLKHKTGKLANSTTDSDGDLQQTLYCCVHMRICMNNATYFTFQEAASLF